MPSITPTMLAISADACVMSFIVDTTSRTTVPPRSATSDADSARRFTWLAASAGLRAVPAISSSAAAVSCRLDAACSVRADRSWLPCAISALARFTDVLKSRICRRIVLIFSANALNALAICAASSAPSAGRRFVRSPLPLETSVSASRTIRMCLKAAFVIAPTSAAAMMATHVASIRARIDDSMMTSVSVTA